MSFELDQFCGFRLQSNCLNGFNKHAFLEITLLVKSSLPSFRKRYPSDSEGFSTIDTAVIQISNPHEMLGEYTEVIFKKVIVCHVKLLIYGTLIGYNFERVNNEKTESQKIDLNSFSKVEKETFRWFLKSIAKKNVKHVEDFQTFFVGREIAAARKMFLAVNKYVQQLGVFYADSKQKTVDAMRISLELINTEIDSLNEVYKTACRKNAIKSVDFNLADEPRSQRAYSEPVPETSIVDSHETLKSGQVYSLHRKTQLVEVPQKSTDRIDVQKEQFDAFFKQTMQNLPSQRHNNSGSPEKRVCFPSFEAESIISSTNLSLRELNDGVSFEDACECLRCLMTVSSSLIFKMEIMLTDIIKTVPGHLRGILRPHFLQSMRNRLFMNVLTTNHQNIDFFKNVSVAKQRTKIAQETRKQSLLHQVEIARTENVAFFKNPLKMPVFFEDVFCGESAKSQISSTFANEIEPQFGKMGQKIQANEPFLFRKKNQKNETEFKIIPLSFLKIDAKIMKRERHLIVFVHGYGGSDSDMRFYKNYILTLLPETIFLASSCNSDTKNVSILTLGQNLAKEILEFTKMLNVSTIEKLSFIGHSLGGLVIRASIPYLGNFQSKFWTLMTLASPHLGFTNHQSVVALAGFSLFKKIGGEKIFEELDLSDAKNIKDTVLHKLSVNKSLESFKHIILVSSQQDNYCPNDSARIQKPTDSKDVARYKLMSEMVETIFGGCQARRVHKLDIDVVDEAERMVDWVTGRTAHVDLISDPMIILTILLKFVDYFV